MTWLVVDLGSSSVRALLFADDLRLIENATSSRKHDFFTDRAGRATADPLALQNLVETCLDEILQHPAARKIRALGMATFAGNWLGLDAAGNACTPVMTYADTLSRDEIPQLLGKLGDDAEAYNQAVGCMLHPAYLPAQYAYLQNQQPDTARGIHRLSDIGAYLYRQWFARDIPTSYSIASWSGLLDRRQRDWHWGYAKALIGSGFSEKLPALADYDALQTGLAPRYRQRWSALRDCPFFLALGDGAAANIGSGAVDAGRIALTIGTTSALRAVKQIQPLPAGLWSYLVSADLPLLGGATSEGGNVYQWALEELLLEELLLEEEMLEAQLSKRQPDAHGLTVLPLLAGERSPGWHPNAAGTIHGLRRHSNRLDILQAHLEAVAIRLSLIFDLLKTEDAIVMAGGGALQSSPAWAQMIANAFDAPIHLLQEAEVTARGVALLMRQTLDGTALDVTPPQISRVLQPDPADVKLLRGARQRQLELYQRLYA